MSGIVSALVHDGVIKPKGDKQTSPRWGSRRRIASKRYTLIRTIEESERSASGEASRHWTDLQITRPPRIASSTRFLTFAATWSFCFPSTGFVLLRVGRCRNKDLMILLNPTMLGGGVDTTFRGEIDCREEAGPWRMKLMKQISG